MAHLSTHTEPTMPAQQNSMLLATLTRWWSPAQTSSACDPEIGYESALPWTLSDAPAEPGAPVGRSTWARTSQ